MSFKNISLKGYRKLLQKRMFDMTFPTPEILNKYRDNDENINQKILHDEQINKQNENLSELFDKNLNKYFNEKTKNTSTDLIGMNDKK